MPRSTASTSAKLHSTEEPATVPRGVKYPTTLGHALVRFEKTILITGITILINYVTVFDYF